METIITAATILAMYFNSATIDGSKYCYNADLSNGQVTTLYVYAQKGEQLRNHLEYRYEYDKADRLVQKETLRWDAESQQWRRKSCLCFSYNETGYTVEHCLWDSKLQAYAEADEIAFESLCEGLSEEERAQLISITDVMVANAIKYIGGNACCDDASKKGCECESDKEACAESAGI